MNSVILEARSLTKEYKPHKFADKKGENLWFYRSEWGWQDYFFKTGHGTCISDKRHAFLMGKIRNCGITETA